MRLNLSILEASQRALWVRLAGHASIASFHLAGGTALALQEGHRRSVDFDFFTVSPSLTLPDLKEFQRKFFRGAGGGITRQERGLLHAIVSGAHVRFRAIPNPLVRPLVRSGRARLAHPVDIGLTKLSAIVSRGERKDFIDLACILTRHIRLSALLKLAGRKYAGSRDFAVQALRALVYFADADRGADPKGVVDEFAWPKVRMLIEREARLTMKAVLR